MMPPLETYQAFLKAKNLKPHTPPQHVLDAAAPFVARGFKPVGISVSASFPVPNEDRTIANDLLNRAQEAASAAKASAGNRPNTEGTEAGTGFNLWAEFIARLVMNPGALTPLERRYSLIAQAAREDRHDIAMRLLEGWGGAPNAAPTIDADAVAALADQIKRKVGR